MALLVETDGLVLDPSPECGTISGINYVGRLLSAYRAKGW